MPHILQKYSLQPNPFWTILQLCPRIPPGPTPWSHLSLHYDTENNVLNVVHEKVISHNNYVSLTLYKASQCSFSYFLFIWLGVPFNRSGKDSQIKPFTSYFYNTWYKKKASTGTEYSHAHLSFGELCVIKNTFSGALWRKKNKFLCLHFYLLGSSVTSLLNFPT